MAWTSAAWWWLGAHGGAGVSTLQGWIPGGADAYRWWPDPAYGGPVVVVLVCRTHAGGLARARDAVRQWAARRVPGGLQLGGVVAIADGPGRLPRPQAEALQLLSGVVPRMWRVPWIEELRAVTPPAVLMRPPAAGRLAADLSVLLPSSVRA